jgi:hypothetical protein
MFTITEDINSDDDYEEFDQDESDSDEEAEQSQDEAQQPRKLKLLESNTNDTEYKPAKFVQPLDYSKLKDEQDQHGVIFVEKPLNVDLVERFKNEKAIERYLSEFGTITRVKAAFEVRKRKRYLTGYYVEFEKKSVAKRVALTLNGAPISRHDSRTMNVKYIVNFNWNSIGEEQERRKMYKKLLRAEAEKELRAVRTYKKQTKWSDSIREKKVTVQPDKSFRFNQKKFTKYNKEQNIHLNFLNIFTNSK